MVINSNVLRKYKIWQSGTPVPQSMLWANWAVGKFGQTESPTFNPHSFLNKFQVDRFNEMSGNDFVHVESYLNREFE